MADRTEFGLIAAQAVFDAIAYIACAFTGVALYDYIVGFG